MSPTSLLKELLLYSTIMILGTLLLVHYDAFETLYTFTRIHEDWDLDEYFLAIPFALICLALFAFNRSRALRARAKELEQARHDLDETHERLMQMAQDRENFIAVSCHELKSPLNGIVHALELTESGVNAAEREEGFSLAKSAARGLGTVIDGVLEFARLENVDQRRQSTFSPRDLIKALRTMSRLQADAKGLALEITLDESVPEQLVGPEAGLRLAILNLVGNAIKYTESGSVSVSISSDTMNGTRELVVTVADTGIGIPPDELKSIFDPYQRTSLARGPGLGLGLTIVQRLAEGMNGSVSVSSAVGQGTEFILRVPVTPA